MKPRSRPMAACATPRSRPSTMMLPSARTSAPGFTSPTITRWPGWSTIIPDRTGPITRRAPGRMASPIGIAIEPLAVDALGAATGAELEVGRLIDAVGVGPWPEVVGTPVAVVGAELVAGIAVGALPLGEAMGLEDEIDSSGTGA